MNLKNVKNIYIYIYIYIYRAIEMDDRLKMCRVYI